MAFADSLMDQLRRELRHPHRWHETYRQLNVLLRETARTRQLGVESLTALPSVAAVMDAAPAVQPVGQLPMTDDEVEQELRRLLGIRKHRQRSVSVANYTADKNDDLAGIAQKAYDDATRG